MIPIPTTMKAAVYHPGNNNLVIDQKYPIRPLKANEVLLRVSACGVGNTDVAILSGASTDPRTYILGHEISGVPVLLGDQVDKKITPGKLYSVLTISGQEHGINGGSAFLNTIGLGLDGGYAEYVIVTEANLVEVPEGVSAEAAAVASDAGITSYNTVKNTAGVTKGTKVLIFGIGGLGHLAVQFAKHLGATVFVCDVKPEARRLALDLGADGAFDLIELTNKTAAGFTVDTTIDFVVNNQSFNLAMAALKGNEVNFPFISKLVLAGISAEKLSFIDVTTITSGVQILSNSYGPKSALEEVLDLFAKGLIHPSIQSEPLEDIGKVINELRSSRITGKKVVVPKL
ncbi:GroES-like protein [Mycena belliarum]|uniref:GroES-like protein n=1 Tax=Mycena belliarum TaxID=1033014 RepID=A0AAD6XR05_9AGAR|nr:GroES-like protein [Mycena belliae]